MMKEEAIHFQLRVTEEEICFEAIWMYKNMMQPHSFLCKGQHHNKSFWKVYFLSIERLI